MVTPQTNTTLSEIAERLKVLDDFVICGHVNPDGDCLGSQLALCHALRALGKKATCVLARNEPIEVGLQFLPGSESLLWADDYAEPCSVFIAVDVPTIERIGDAAQLHERASLHFTIDHHAVDTSMAEFTYVDPDASATCLLIWELTSYLGGRCRDVAHCCLTGLITDTGRFAYQNTDARSFAAAAEMMEWGADPTEVNREFFQSRSLASIELEKITLEHMEFYEQGQFVLSYLSKDDFTACKALKADAEPLIDSLRSIRGVKVALILRETDEAVIRGSLRAKDDETDVAAVARTFEGGGHKAAAGFTFHGTLDQARSAAYKAVMSQCFSQTSNFAASDISVDTVHPSSKTHSGCQTEAGEQSE